MAAAHSLIGAQHADGDALAAATSRRGAALADIPKTLTSANADPRDRPGHLVASRSRQPSMYEPQSSSPPLVNAASAWRKAPARSARTCTLTSACDGRRP